MRAAGVQANDPLGTWCGWVLAAAAALTPLIAWLGPLGFALLLASAGLLCLPAARVGARDWPLAAMLAAGVAWAVASMLWSPFRPGEPDENVGLKLALQVPLYWSAWQGARRADPALRRLALRIFAWGLAAYGAVLLVEAFTGAAVYRALRDLLGDPIRPDLARKNVAQGSFVLALLWPVALAGGVRAGASPWLALPMAAGTALLAQNFLSDAPTLAVGLAVAVGALVWTWPRSAPRALGVAVALLILAMPLLVLAARGLAAAPHLPVSWAQRIGYWTYALGRIADHPWRGWGLDASRTFSPHIQLHPHNGPLQLWLELGLLGAALGSVVWIVVFRRLARDTHSLAAVGAAASASVYAFFGAISFGVWQEWWLALAALVAVIAALADAEEGATATT